MQYQKFSKIYHKYMVNNDLNKNPRIIIVQKLYSYFLNKDTKIIYPKHRYKKFIKDTVSGTIEREEFCWINLKYFEKMNLIHPEQI